jgi:6-phosphofructokinase
MYGANMLHAEWAKYMQELVAEKAIDEATVARHPFLSLICLPSSPDNSVCDTEFNIGADTALHRVSFYYQKEGEEGRDLFYWFTPFDIV